MKNKVVEKLYQNKKKLYYNVTAKYYVEDIDNIFQESVLNIVKGDLDRFVGESEKHIENKVNKCFKITFEGMIKDQNKKKKLTDAELRDIELDRIAANEREQKILGQNKLDKDAYKCFKKQNPESELTFKEYVKLLDEEEKKNIEWLKNEREIKRLVKNDHRSITEERKKTQEEHIKYLQHNWKKCLTKKQKQKVHKLIAAIEQGIDIFDHKDPNKLKISAVSKIWYPDKSASNANKQTKEMLQRIRENLVNELTNKNIAVSRKEDEKHVK